MMDLLKHIQVEMAYSLIAIAGGCARYFNSYISGKPFKLGVFLASAFTAGFSGWMFALLGVSLNMPQPMLFMMAGVGGFFGEQSLKFILEFITKRAQ